MKITTFTSLLISEPGEHLVKDVVVLLLGQWVDDSGLVQEVAVDFCAVQGPVCYLHFNEMALFPRQVKSSRVSRYVNLVLMNDETLDIIQPSRRIRSIDKVNRSIIRSGHYQQ
jgi:hypothetical protein